jgi:hypothetical protein
MREEREVLEDVADAAGAGGEVDAARGVEEGAAVDADESGVGPLQPGDGLERERLARARRAEEDGHAGRRLELHVEREAAARHLLPNPDGEHRSFQPAAVRRLVA